MKWLGAVPPEGLKADEERPLAEDATTVEQLATELRTTRADLQAAMQELASSNEELRSSNEELVSTNEELQSANEELQTSKEEMQSINEELESLNSELRVKIEEATAANTEVQNLYASSEIATILIDQELRISRFTPAAKVLLHLIDADVGRPLADLVQRFQGEHLVADAQETLKTGTSFERQVHTPQGEWFIKRIRPYRLLGGEIAAVSATFVDISNLKHTEGALREIEERFRTMADAIPQLAWSAHADGFIHWYNRRWYEYTGTTPKQVEGWGWQSVHDPTALPAVIERWKASIATGQPFDMEFPLRGADGRFRRFLTRVMPLKDSEGRVTQWFGTNTDISELVEAQEALREADQHKNEFLAVLSHELRTPLTPIRNSLYILERTPPGGEQAQRA